MGPEMAQPVKTLAAKPDNLSLILGTHMVEGQNWRTKSHRLSPDHTLQINTCRKQNCVDCEYVHPEVVLVMRPSTKQCG